VIGSAKVKPFSTPATISYYFINNFKTIKSSRVQHADSVLDPDWDEAHPCDSPGALSFSGTGSP
jgi:hypothetical protein